MCASSAISDYYMYQYPNRQSPFNQFGQPMMPVQSFDLETKELLRRAFEILERVDKKLGDIECKDEAKTAFLKSIGYEEPAAKTV